MQQVPSLRARVVAVNGVPADQVAGHAGYRLGVARRSRPDLRRRRCRRARGWSRARGGRRTTTGRRWSRSTPTSPKAGASGSATSSGSTCSGRDIDLRVASLRDIAWRTMGLNFTMVASPGLLEHAPHTHIATVRATAGGAGRAAAGGDGRVPECLGHPGRGRAAGGRRPARTARGGAERDRVADAARPGRWCWPARSPPGSGGGCGRR